MSVLSTLKNRWEHLNRPFMIREDDEIFFNDIVTSMSVDLSTIMAGDVVALIGDFEPTTISTLLRLIDLNTVLVPLTVETSHDHDYFFESAGVDVVIEGTSIKRIRELQYDHKLLNILRQDNKPGLVLFSTGTTGRPKAILHDLTLFIKRFKTPRPTLKTLNFLLFDHIGGLNTLLHTLYNKGTIVSCSQRTVGNVLNICKEYEIELLPTTPTFLRMLLLSGCIPDMIPNSLKIITYGTERMDQTTLTKLCKLLPNVDFRQTFGMSELGIVRVKSENRDSLYMRIGGEGVETKIVDSVLYIKSHNRMLGYLNAETPFDSEGWYNTKDVVRSKGELIEVIGRDSEEINVGGLKFMASEVERVALEYPGIIHAKVVAKPNPITGNHVEMTIQLEDNNYLDRTVLAKYFKKNLPSHMRPQKIVFGVITIGHRFKKL